MFRKRLSKSEKKKKKHLQNKAPPHLFTSFERRKHSSLVRVIKLLTATTADNAGSEFEPPAYRISKTWGWNDLSSPKRHNETREEWCSSYRLPPKDKQVTAGNCAKDH